jgi:hypothetical protein
MTGSLLAAGLLVSAGLLVLAGLAKLVRPEGTARALSQAGLRRWGRPGWVRAGAAVEVVCGVGAIAFGGVVLAALVALSYLAFAAFTATALRRGWALSSCGCFGEPDAPPTRGHVVMDLLLALAALGSRRPLDVVARHPAEGVLLCAVSALIAGLAYLVLARLPKVLDLR